MECRRWAAGAGACPGTSLPITTQSNFQTSRYTTQEQTPRPALKEGRQKSGKVAEQG